MRETSNGEVPVEQADRLIGLMNGDIGEVRSAVSWKAPKAEFKKRDKRAKLTYRLYECPRCKLESVTADAAVFNGKAWKEVSNASVKRRLEGGMTLWPEFK